MKVSNVGNASYIQRLKIMKVKSRASQKSMHLNFKMLGIIPIGGVSKRYEGLNEALFQDNVQHLEVL